MITFQNPGTMDIRAATTFGVSAKENDNPIGYFGTGLKYAIAIILRLGGKIAISTDGRTYEFTAEHGTVRGKEFSFVHMNGVPLGFTTHMGANWEPWQAFRELYCNALDEGGDVVYDEFHTDGSRPWTFVKVKCEELEACYHKRHSIVLPKHTERVTRLGTIEVLPGKSNHIYYRGILAAELEHASMFTYNVLEPQVLTEDRTLKHPHLAVHALRKGVLGCMDRAFIRQFIQADRETLENKMDLAGWGDQVSEACLDVMADCVNDVEHPLNPTVIRLLSEKRPVAEVIKAAKLDSHDQKMLERSKDMLRFMGFDIDKHSILVVDNLGPQILGTVHNKQILISKRAFVIGDKTVAGTILEEFLHREFLFQDMTRDFQNFLIDQIMTFGMKLKEATDGRYA